MNNFSGISLRLKQELRVSNDKEVAAALGLGNTAWANRKKREAFPETELRALAASRPEIDVNYVLTGKRSQAHVMAKIATAGERVRMVRGTRTAQQFAQALGIDAGYLEKVETAGEWLSNELLMRIVEVERVSPMWLLSGELPVLEGELSPMEISLIDNYRHCGAKQQTELRGQAGVLRAQTITAQAPAAKAPEIDLVADYQPKKAKPRAKKS